MSICNAILGPSPQKTRNPGLTVCALLNKTRLCTGSSLLIFVQVPKTCENFILLAEKGYYNGTKFHRSIRNFMVWGQARVLCRELLQVVFACVESEATSSRTFALFLYPFNSNGFTVVSRHSAPLPAHTAVFCKQGKRPRTSGAQEPLYAARVHGDDLQDLLKTNPLLSPPSISNRSKEVTPPALAAAASRHGYV